MAPPKHYVAPCHRSDMYHLFNKDNPLMHQHVIHVGRHELLKQHAAFLANNVPLPIWFNRVTISINDTIREESQMRDVFEDAGLYVLCQDDESMTQQQAEQIYQFVTENCYGNFVVHCYLGVSRSAAVAKWITEYLGIGDVEMETYVGFNQHIYNLLCKVSSEGKIIQTKGYCG